ncbi:MAG: DUF2961 domain-containing protein [Blautia wexlerae]
MPAFFYQVDYCLYDEELPDDITYFHAQWRTRATDRVSRRDYMILDGCKRKRSLCRNLYCTYHTGTLLVGRRRNEILY